MELIDRSVILEELEYQHSPHNIYLREVLANCTPIEAKPIIHSKWNKVPRLNVYTCDYCGRLFRDYAVYYSYCPYCGALMDLEDSDES